MALVTQHIMNICQEGLGNAVLATKEGGTRRNASVLKVNGQMGSNGFKKKPFYSNNFGIRKSTL